ncbi:GNAT family N-acetyltransferase [Dawidia soli]|uniref:GNAT family N-acetyltransferase n=1 Tax=Dawidia soli TaxID=2782352 RepID=A0AAP2GIN3_9BACT|nr:GNAT family N-acetyltransferase [Dawidia soli]MBT1687620.1 GNAT family N-acetyltransferase [Dawidia soli]
MTHPLDNPVWSALTTGNKDIALGSDKVKFYRLDISLFAGLVENSADNLLKLHAIAPGDAGVFGVVSFGNLDIPRSWTIAHSVPVLQMVCEQPVYRAAATTPMADLSDEHIPQMLALAELTKPGPFRERTIDFGHYQGIFDGTRLVAMAGQRMHATPYAEISAVCTHPDYAGRGYAAQLIINQMKRIVGGGEIPFLHVTTTNERAIKLYESLGFTGRRELVVYFIEK